MSAATSMSTPPRLRLPQLPLEIWTAIASHLTGSPADLCWLWLKLRCVSRSFNAAVETAVRNCALRQAEITVPFHRPVAAVGQDLSMPGRFRVGSVWLGTIVARFDHFSEDGERVFFRDADASERMDAEELGHSVNSWRRTVEMYLADARGDVNFGDPPDHDALLMLQRFRFDQPPYVITMGGMVNDTELPDLQVDFERLEMSFCWKQMVTGFLGEEERVAHLENATKISQHSRLSDMRESLRAGRLDLDDALLAGVDMSRLQEQIRRKVRCYRFQRGYQRIGRPILGDGSVGQPGRVEENLRLSYMRDIRATLSTKAVSLGRGSLHRLGPSRRWN